MAGHKRLPPRHHVSDRATCDTIRIVDRAGRPVHCFRRQQDIDRKQAENDYQINIKAELEIELLHQKIDELREKEVLALTQAANDLSQLLNQQRSEP